MAQAEAVADLLTQLDAADLGVILFSGWRLDELQPMAIKRPAIRNVLDRIDLLIDGRYEHARNDSLGLRGSSNQRLWFFSSRYRSWEQALATGERRIEVQQQPDGEMIVGVPSLDDWRRMVLELPAGLPGPTDQAE